MPSARLLVLAMLPCTLCVLGYIPSTKRITKPKTDVKGSRRRKRIHITWTSENPSQVNGREDPHGSLLTLSQSSTGIAVPIPGTPPVSATLSPLEAWSLSHLDQWYEESQSVKCPFLRRRWGDLLDSVETVMKHTVIRRQCWPLMGPPQAWRPAGRNKKRRSIKYKGLSLPQLKAHVLTDWKAATGKGYYVTGKLTTAVYRDDCLFLGPDPDMPIRGLRKYVGVAAHLFDFDHSCATLKSLDIIDDALVAKWQLQGILRLPWKPHLPTFSGATVYHVDADGLIYQHEESWDMSVAHAFVHTLLPDLAKHIWKEEDDKANE